MSRRYVDKTPDFTDKVLMKISVFIAFLFCVFCASAFAQHRLDASTDAALAESFQKMAFSLSPDERQDLSNASAILMYYGSKNGLGEAKMRKIFHGKTAREVVETALKVCPFAKDETLKINSRTPADFSKSYAELLMNLPLKKQRALSAAISQALLTGQASGRQYIEILAEFNGKTADEIIAQFGGKLAF